METVFLHLSVVITPFLSTNDLKNTHKAFAGFKDIQSNFDHIEIEARMLNKRLNTVGNEISLITTLYKRHQHFDKYYDDELMLLRNSKQVEFVKEVDNIYDGGKEDDLNTRFKFFEDLDPGFISKLENNTHGTFLDEYAMLFKLRHAFLKHGVFDRYDEAMREFLKKKPGTKYRDIFVQEKMKSILEKYTGRKSYKFPSKVGIKKKLLMKKLL